MNRLFVDTNIVLDLLGQRKDYYRDSQDLFSLTQEGRIEIVVSALSFANTHYILAEQLKMQKVKSILSKFKSLVTVAPLDNEILELALDNDFKDFEDGIQYFTAVEADCDVIITRNKKDFKKSKLPIFNASEFLIILES